MMNKFSTGRSCFRPEGLSDYHCLTPKPRRLTTLIMLLVLTSQLAISQSRIVEGRVIDKTTGEEVSFASVGIKDNAIGTSSNVDGYFSIKIPASLDGKDIVLTFSCVGFETFALKNPEDSVVIYLTPSRLQLRELLVFNHNLKPERIVSRAFSRITLNYNIEPFVYKSFYRHYCKDDSIYGRLIEAAVDIYKRKGYRIQQHMPGDKEEVKVTQLRRSLDHSKISSSHVPISLYSVMGADPVSYQTKSKRGMEMFKRYYVSSLKKNMKRFSFSFDGITEYDGEEVYRIRYELKNDDTFDTHQDGVLYITTGDYAIIKSEWNGYSETDTTRSFTIYKKYNYKYYHHHTLVEGSTFNPLEEYNHKFHLELLTNDIVLHNFPTFKGKEPGREELLKVSYDTTFWNNYNILKATPLEESIVRDLEKDEVLDKQYTDYVQVEQDRYFGDKGAEEKLISLLATLKGEKPVYIDLWASWCGPCMREMRYSRDLFSKYRSKITFVYLSLDEDRMAWRKAIKGYGLEMQGMRHFRLGERSDFLKMVDVKEIPRYILIRRNGEFAELNARPPSDPDLPADFEKLIAE